MGNEKDGQAETQAQGRARFPLGMACLPGFSLVLQLRMVRLRPVLTGKSYPGPVFTGWGCVVLNKSESLGASVSSYVHRIDGCRPATSQGYKVDTLDKEAVCA